REQDERLEPRDRVAWIVGVKRAHGSVVAGVHRLEHVEGLAAANFAHDDPVRPHAQRVAHQVTDHDLASPLDVGRFRFETDHVHLSQAELGCVLAGDDALVAWDETRQYIEQRRLAGAGAARDRKSTRLNSSHEWISYA